MRSSENKQELIQSLNQTIANCQKCELCYGRMNVVPGQLVENSELMFIGEAPGANEDMKGLPFIGRSGEALNKKIVKYGVKRGNVSVVNVVKCRPPGNRTPKEEEIMACNDYLKEQIAWVDPKIIVLLGKTAAWTLMMQNKWENSISLPLNKMDSMKSMFGKVFEIKVVDKSYPAVVVYHPSYWLRNTAQGDYWVNKQFELIRKMLDERTGES